MIAPLRRSRDREAERLEQIVALQAHCDRLIVERDEARRGGVRSLVVAWLLSRADAYDADARHLGAQVAANVAGGGNPSRVDRQKFATAMASELRDCARELP